MLVWAGRGGKLYIQTFSAATMARFSIGQTDERAYGVKHVCKQRAKSGKHPISSLVASRHTDHRTHMLVRKVIKATFRKVKRSGLYYLMICNLPVRRASETETGWDALGAVMVIGLLAGMVILMRIYLTG